MSYLSSSQFEAVHTQHESTKSCACGERWRLWKEDTFDVADYGKIAGEDRAEAQALKRRIALRIGRGKINSIQKVVTLRHSQLVEASRKDGILEKESSKHKVLRRTGHKRIREAVVFFSLDRAQTPCTAYSTPERGREYTPYESRRGA
jgi:hypothetical protein